MSSQRSKGDEVMEGDQVAEQEQREADEGEQRSHFGLVVVLCLSKESL